MENVSFIIFDLDETLIDNYEYDHKFWYGVLSLEIRKHTGKGLREINRELRKLSNEIKGTAEYYYPQTYLKHFGIEGGSIDPLIEQNIKLVRAWDWVVPTLEKLAKGHTLILCTNAIFDVATAKLDSSGLIGYFDKVDTTEKRTKFCVGRFKKLLATLKTSPKDCVFVTNDTDYDEYLLACGMERIVRVTPGRLPKELGDLMQSVEVEENTREACEKEVTETEKEESPMVVGLKENPAQPLPTSTRVHMPPHHQQQLADLLEKQLAEKEKVKDSQRQLRGMQKPGWNELSYPQRKHAAEIVFGLEDVFKFLEDVSKSLEKSFIKDQDE